MVYFSGSQVLFQSTLAAMSSACCCCVCDAGRSPTSCEYSTASGQSPSQWSTMPGFQLDIAGSCTHRAVRDPSDSYDVCTPASCACPSGTWVIACGGSRWQRQDVVCEDSNYWYVTTIIFQMNCSCGFCNSNVEMAKFEICSRTTYVSKTTGTLDPETGLGWIAKTYSAVGCTLANPRVVGWKNNQPGYTGWAQELTGSCRASCATPICIPQLPTNLVVLSDTTTLGGRRDGGCDPSGLTLAVTALP